MWGALYATVWGSGEGFSFPWRGLWKYLRVNIFLLWLQHHLPRPC